MTPTPMSKTSHITGLVFALLMSPFTQAVAQVSVVSALADDTEATPGETYEGIIIVKNGTGEPQQVKVYQTDYLFYSDGSNFYGESGSTERSNAEWVRVPSSAVTIPPLETVSITYIVEVPKDWHGQPPVGSYWSMIMIEGVPSGSPESTLEIKDAKIQVGIRQIIRYAVQVATHVRDTGISRLKMSSPVLVTNDEGAPELQLDVENEGSRMVRIQNWVEIYDENGNALGRRDGVPHRIYPGTSVRQRYQLGKLLPGSYRALVILDAGSGTVDAAEYTVLIE